MMRLQATVQGSGFSNTRRCRRWEVLVTAVATDEVAHEKRTKTRCA